MDCSHTLSRWQPQVRVAYDYYPFGLTWHNPAAADTPEGRHDHAYQDKEFQWNEFGAGAGMALYDFHARMYDPATATWSVPDPAEQFSNPYLAMGNNPVIAVDPDGRIAWLVPVVIGAAIGGTIGGLAAKNNDEDVWKGIVVGAMVGAAVGLGLSAGLSAAGVHTASNAPLIKGIGANGGSITGATKLSFNVLSNGLLTSNINMASALAQNKSFSQIATDGMIGFVAGSIGGSIGPIQKALPMKATTFKAQNFVTSVLNGFGTRYSDALYRGLDSQIALKNGFYGAVEGAMSAHMTGDKRLAKLFGNTTGDLLFRRFATATMTQSITSIPGLGYSLYNFYGPFVVGRHFWAYGPAMKFLGIGSSLEMFEFLSAPHYYGLNGQPSWAGDFSDYPYVVVPYGYQNIMDLFN